MNAGEKVANVYLNCATLGCKILCNNLRGMLIYNVSFC